MKFATVDDAKSDPRTDYRQLAIKIAALNSDFAAIALAPRVYWQKNPKVDELKGITDAFDKNKIDPRKGPEAAGSIAHELQHLIQTIRLQVVSKKGKRGRNLFLGNYLDEAKKKRYEDISFEKEAFAVQDAVERVLKKPDNQKRFNKLLAKFGKIHATSKDFKRGVHKGAADNSQHRISLWENDAKILFGEFLEIMNTKYRPILKQIQNRGHADTRLSYPEFK